MSTKQPQNRRQSVTPGEAMQSRFQSGWLDRLDSRHNLTRELRERYAEVCTDLGGADSLSYMQRGMVERLLWLEYWLSQQEQALAKGQDFDVSRWIQAANSYQGLSKTLGLERKAKEAPTLGEYLAKREAQS